MRNILITLFVVAVPRAALACPVCFGHNDSPMARAANISILAMLVVVAGVLAGFASFFIHLMRRARQLAGEASGPADSLRQGYLGPPKLHAQADAGRHVLEASGPQEGIAQC